MEPSQDTIMVRLNRLMEQLCKKYSSHSLDSEMNISNDILLDGLLVLYDECNTDSLKSTDSNIANFVNLYRKAIIQLKCLRVNISDFEVKGIIGRGHFGDVHVVKEKQTGDIYAMKTIPKTSSLTFKEEKNIMATSQSLWITILQYSFQDCNNLYFVMEYHPGGDLLGLIYRQGGSITETAATFYVAELVLALNDLHKLGYVHRDIKPDNILLDRCGHLKLADFGSAARLDNKGMITHGLPIGTPDYIAPEVLQCMDNKINEDKPTYGTACDYWSLGILAYELVVGNTPFSGQNTTATYSKIIAYANNLKFPTEILLSQGYAQLLKKLIHTNVNVRLNHSTIWTEPIFQYADINTIRDQVPPYVPYIKTMDDTSNFTDIQIKSNTANINIDNFKRRKQFSGKHLLYLGFTYVNVLQQSKQIQCIPSVKMVKDELLETMKKEINALKKKQTKRDTTFNDWENHKIALECNLEEKIRKLESLETVRDRLEGDLAAALSESTTLKRTLELERKDRSELEFKALDIIKSTKSKWEASEKLQRDALQMEIENQKEWIEKLRADNALLSQELKINRNESNLHKKSIDKVEHLRRNSVVSLENRVEKITNDSHVKISSMQLELSKIAKEKFEIETEIVQQKIEAELRNNFINTKKQLSDSKMQNEKRMAILKDYENKIISLTADNSNSKRIIDELKIQISVISSIEKKQIDNSVQEELKKNTTLETELKQLQEDLSRAQTIYKQNEQQLKLRYESQIDELQNTIGHLRNEQESLRTDLRTAQENEDDNREKVRHLEELLSRLVSGVTHLESGPNGDQLLQDQIKRLEENILQVHEKLTLEKHEHLQLKLAFWRLKKDLTNAELDRKIVERDLKDAKTKNCTLEQNIDALEHKISDMVITKDSIVTKASSDKDTLQNEIESLRISLYENANELHLEKKCAQEQNVCIGVLREEIQTKSSELHEALSVVMDFEKKKNILQEEKVLNETELQKLQSDACKYENDLLMLTQEINNHVLNRGALREACTILEEQLIEFERIYNINESKRIGLSEQLANAQISCASMKDELQQARRQANEEKSLRHFAETKAQRSDEDLTFLHQERVTQAEHITEYKRYAAELTEELNKNELKLGNCECTLREYKRHLESSLSECDSLKEENSLHRTAISDMKESIYRLEHELLDAQTDATIGFNKIKNLEDLLGEKISYYEEKDLKKQSTIQQQTKLIDFMQLKIEESKKKKTLSDKLFGQSRKENTIPTSQTLNYRNLEKKYAKEREQTDILRNEMIQLRSKLQSKNLKGKDILALVNGQDNLKEETVSVHVEPQRAFNRFESNVCNQQSKSSYKTYDKDSENKIQDDGKNLLKFPIKLEGWIKIPMNGNWTKHYACLTANCLHIYVTSELSSAPIQTLQLKASDTFGKVALEPVASEIAIPVSTTDLPFVLKVNVSPITSCWPQELFIFMTYNLEDKDKWYNALDNIFCTPESKTTSGEIIFNLPSSFKINLVSNLPGTDRNHILCTMSGLYAKNDDPTAEALYIAGPLQVHDISILLVNELVLMVIDEKQVLIQCDLQHLQILTNCSYCTAPTLKFKPIPILSNNKLLDGFRRVRSCATNILCGQQEMACACTDKQIVIMAVDVSTRRLQAIRVLDTAEPTSCMLFTEFSLLIAADKFFAVNLRTLDVDEFLDHSDYRLQSSINCYKMRSFPITVLEIISNVEFLIVYNEFGVFVDKNGSTTRKKDIVWSQSPRHLHYADVYLYVIQFSAVEISKITSETCNSNDLECLVKIEFDRIYRFLGGIHNGIYVEHDDAIQYICAGNFDDDLSTKIEMQSNNPVNEEVLNVSYDRFSFTSSMVRSLEDDFSDNDFNINEEKKVQFVTEANT